MPTEVHRATVADAYTVAVLLDDFNREFKTPTPGPDTLGQRLTELLAGDDLAALLIGEPAAGVAVVSFRPNVWYAGPVALLDELYVHPARAAAGSRAVRSRLRYVPGAGSRVTGDQCGR